MDNSEETRCNCQERCLRNLHGHNLIPRYGALRRSVSFAAEVLIAPVADGVVRLPSQKSIPPTCFHAVETVVSTNSLSLSLSLLQTSLPFSLRSFLSIYPPFVLPPSVTIAPRES